MIVASGRGLSAISPTVQAVAEQLGAAIVPHQLDWVGPFPRPEEYDLVLPDGTVIPAISVQAAVERAESPSAAAGALQSVIWTAEYAQKGGGPQAAIERTYAMAPETFGPGTALALRAAATTPVTQPNQTVVSTPATVSAPVTAQPSITQTAGAGALALAPGLTDWIKANQTLLLVGGAGLLALFLFMGRR